MMLNFNIDELKKCFDFAKAMRGNHSPNMIMNRADWEIFRDDFRGKLGEIAVYKYISKYLPYTKIAGCPDFSVTPRGQWDITDLIINNKYVNVKSIRQNSNFLLVETPRYDNYGNYNYLNNDNNPVKIDYYILVRVTIDPDTQRNIFLQTFERFLKDGYKDGKSVPRKIYAEILGGISHPDFWKKKHFAPKGIRCDYKNLNFICNDGDISHLPSQITYYDKKNNILQKDNYVVSIDKLSPLEELFFPEYSLV